MRTIALNVLCVRLPRMLLLSSCRKRPSRRSLWRFRYCTRFGRSSRPVQIYGNCIENVTREKRTWLSTSIAMSMNISYSSLMLFSSFMMSSCRASISASVCFACAVSVMICTRCSSEFQAQFALTPCVKTAVLPLAIMSSNWFSSIFCPAVRVQMHWITQRHAHRFQIVSQYDPCNAPCSQLAPCYTPAEFRRTFVRASSAASCVCAHRW